MSAPGPCTISSPGSRTLWSPGRPISAAVPAIRPRSCRRATRMRRSSDSNSSPDMIDGGAKAPSGHCFRGRRHSAMAPGTAVRRHPRQRRAAMDPGPRDAHAGAYREAQRRRRARGANAGQSRRAVASADARGRRRGSLGAQSSRTPPKRAPRATTPDGTSVCSAPTRPMSMSGARPTTTRSPAPMRSSNGSREPVFARSSIRSMRASARRISPATRRPSPRPTRPRSTGPCSCHFRGCSLSPRDDAERFARCCRGR